MSLNDVVVGARNATNDSFLSASFVPFSLILSIVLNAAQRPTLIIGGSGSTPIKLLLLMLFP